jgi:hypothetical protein
MVNDRGRLDSSPKNLGTEDIGEDVGLIGRLMTGKYCKLIDDDTTATAMLGESGSRGYRHWWMANDIW